MSPKIPERLRWAVETLAIQPADHVLEIGCGNGTAAVLVCERLTSGTLTAIDRSETQLAYARANNLASINAGAVSFQRAELETADFGTTLFDKIFAVNVNLFWIKPEKELAVVRQRLAPGGTLGLFYEPPDAAKVQEIVDKVSANLKANGFTVREVVRSGALVGVMAG